jgi:hypothetical protein
MGKVLMSISILFFNVLNVNASCIQGNCSNGYGKLLMKYGGYYEGTFKQSKFHGSGKLVFRDGSVYTGSFENNTMSGYGTFQYKTGHQYNGNFMANKKEGEGTIRMANGDIYVGQWSNDQMNGNGIYTFKDKTRFEGQFKNNMFEGEGTMTSSSGIKTKGYWKENKYISPNTLQSLKNCNLEYCHKNEGEYTYQNGTKLTGYFIDGKPNGTCTVRYPEGSIYTGEWQYDTPNGSGILKRADGKTHNGTWKNGKLIQPANTTQYVKNTLSKPTKTSNETQIHALIVGVADYNHMPSLKYTDDDAYRLYSFLKSPEGGAVKDENIHILIDEAATSTNINEKMNQINRQSNTNDIVMVYLAGHGVNGYFLPYDFDGRSNKISYESIQNAIEINNAKNKIIIVDACHSGSIQNRGPLDIQLQDFYTKLNMTSKSTTFITSSKSEETSLESSGIRQGVFSHYLINGLKGKANKNNDGYISLGELFEYISINVKQYTGNRQTPVIHGDFDTNLPMAMIRK